MSSHPPMEKPKASSDCGSTARSGRRRAAPFGSAATLTDISKTLKLTVDQESTSSTFGLCVIAVTFLTLGLRHPGRGIPKDVPDKKNQGGRTAGTPHSCLPP